MNILDLPKYVETNYFTAWRNTWIHRELGYPYVGYFIKTDSGVVELWARPNTDLEPFLERIEGLGVETVAALAYEVIKRGVRGLFRGTYIYKEGDFLVALDPMLGDRLSFVFYLDGKEFMLTAPQEFSLLWLATFLRSLAKKEKGCDERGLR